MSTEQIITTIITTVFTILLGVISYFLKSWGSRIDQMLKEIQSIKISLEKSDGRFELINQSCKWKHDFIDQKFKDIEKRMIKTETEIDNIKSQK